MWHLHWRADESRRSRAVEPGRARTTVAAARPGRGSFQRVWRDTPAGTIAADVPESVRVRGR